MPESLIELIEAVRRRDEAAVARLVERFHGSAFRLATALVHDDLRAQEVVQTAFITALARLEALKVPEAFPAWFRQIVRTAANRITRAERPIAELREMATESPTPPQVVESRELCDLLHRAMARLPDCGRTAVELFYFQERSIAEVSALLDVPEGTVKRRLHDARLRLRQLLGDADVL